MKHNTIFLLNALFIVVFWAVITIAYTVESPLRVIPLITVAMMMGMQLDPHRFLFWEETKNEETQT